MLIIIRRFSAPSYGIMVMMKLDVRRLRVKNTKHRGLLEFLVYPEKDKYVGVCLTLDIVEEGSDPNRLIESLREAARGHVLLVLKKNLSDDLLNRPAPDEYWAKYFEALEALGSRNKPLKNPPYTFQTPLGKSRARGVPIYA